MQDASIDSALLVLRKRIIRSDGAGLEHVEALLRLRGVTLPVLGPPTPENGAGRLVMRRLVMDALRNGPMRLPAIVAHVAPSLPDVTPDQAYMRTARALSLMRKRGIVGLDGRAWRALKIKGGYPNDSF